MIFPGVSPYYKPPWALFLFCGGWVLLDMRKGFGHPLLPACAALCFFAAALADVVGRKKVGIQGPVIAAEVLAVLAGILLLVSHAMVRNTAYSLLGFAVTLGGSFVLFFTILDKIGNKKPGHKK